MDVLTLNLRAFGERRFSTVYCQVDGSFKEGKAGCGAILFAPSSPIEVKTDDPEAEVLAFIGLSCTAEHALDTEVVAQMLGMVLITAHFKANFQHELLSVCLNRLHEDPLSLAHALLDIAVS